MNSNYDLKIKQKIIDINKNEALSLISNKKPTFTCIIIFQFHLLMER